MKRKLLAQGHKSTRNKVTRYKSTRGKGQGITNDVQRVIGLAIFFMSFWVIGCYSQNQTVIQQNVKEGIAEKQENNDPYLWDFGKVKEGLLVEHEFVFKNESKLILNIKDINTSCGCTISEVKKKKLLPGESTLISVKFNSKEYSGQVTQYIYMNTDSLDNPIIRYIIKANVVK